MSENIKNEMVNEIWRGNTYYQMAHKGSLDISHPGMKILVNIASKAHKILDMGCGDGTRLNTLAGNKKGVGIDISKDAIQLARKKYPELDFIVSDLEKIPLQDENFDLIYSAYVLEHLSYPSKVIKEAIRLILKGGYLVLIAPNYGSPNRCSPPYKKSRVKKILKGMLKDVFLFNHSNIDNWERVNPIVSKDHYDVDWDTTIEPYIGTLISFLKINGMRIEKFSSCWSEELKNAKFHQRLFRFLGERGVQPFLMWGPHFVIVARKVKDES